MKSLPKIAILFFVAISVPISISAQTVADNPIVRTALDEMFENLDKERVPTGYLLDYAMDIVDMDRYTGSELAEDNYVNILTEGRFNSVTFRYSEYSSEMPDYLYGTTH